MRSPRSIALVAALALTIPIGVLGATSTVATAAGIAPPAANRMPGDVPTKKTPWVLDGEVGFTVGDEEVVAEPGTFLAAPPDSRHGFRNPGAARAKVLNLHGPDAGFADSIRRFRPS